MRILIMTPRSPFRGRGADAEDRLAGVTWFKDRGHDVRVITMTMPNDLPYIKEAEQTLDIPITPVPYKFSQPRTKLQSIMRLCKRIVWPLYWDGAAYEYFDSEIQYVYRRSIEEFDPDIAFFDYTFLWPLYKHATLRKIPIITRSANVEAIHFLEENGVGLLNYLRVLPKWLTEAITARKSAFVFAISPDEERTYLRLGARAATLPLRSLPQRQKSHTSRSFEDLETVRLGFTASTYTVAHNRRALEFLLQDVMPLLRNDSQRNYVLRCTGAKLPEHLKAIVARHADIEHVEFTPSIRQFWEETDIAIVPSLSGAGMQQKVFEPIMLGVPTVTSRRAIAGYPFDDRHAAFASSAVEFAYCVRTMAADAQRRSDMSAAARAQASMLFSQEAIDCTMQLGLDSLKKQI